MDTLRNRLVSTAKVFVEHASSANERQSYYSHYPHADAGAKSEAIGEERAWTDAAKALTSLAADTALIEAEAPTDADGLRTDLAFIDGTLDGLGAPTHTKPASETDPIAALTRSQRIRSLCEALKLADAIDNHGLDETLNDLGAPSIRVEQDGEELALSRAGRVAALVAELRENIDQQKQDHAATVADLVSRAEKAEADAQEAQALLAADKANAANPTVAEILDAKAQKANAGKAKQPASVAILEEYQPRAHEDSDD